MTTLPFAPLTWEGLRWQEDAAARRIANRVVVGIKQTEAEVSEYVALRDAVEARMTRLRLS